MKGMHLLLSLGISLLSSAINATDPIINLAGQPDATSVRLFWKPYAGAQPVSEYRIIRNDLYVGGTICKSGYFTDYGLSPNTVYTYSVEVRGLNNKTIYLSDTIHVTTSGHTTIKTHYKLLALVFNPDHVMQSEIDHIRTFLKFRLDFLKYTSNNSAILDLYKDDIVFINSYPPLEYSTQVDYTKLATTAYSELDGNTLIDLVEKQDIDVVWVIGSPPGYDFGENILMGNRSLGNETWVALKVKCSRSFFIHSNLPDARAFDAAAHHVEGTMTSATSGNPDNWKRDKEYLIYSFNRNNNSVFPRKLNLFEQFRLTDEWNGTAAYASKGNANCGSSHFVPGSIRNSATYTDYTYYDFEAWQRYVDCFADDWLTYPYFPGKSRKINGYDFGAFNYYREYETTSYFMFGTASYHFWWFNHIPHNQGITDGKLNNWWPYIYDCNRFDGRFIDYDVDGFPAIPDAYAVNNEEYGTEDDNTDLLGFWVTWNDFGQRGDLSIVKKEESPENVKNGQSSVSVDISVESYTINGRNDLIYPRFKNAHWKLSNIDSIIFSVKPTSKYLISGVNPIFRICTNGNDRIEFVPKKNGKYANFFDVTGLADPNGWYTFRIPLAGDDSWERNIIGYIDPASDPIKQIQAEQQLIASVLSDVNYFEISIQSGGNRGDRLVYFIDNLKMTPKDTVGPLTGLHEEYSSGYSVFPDPVFHDLTIKTPDMGKEVFIRIFDIRGILVYEGMSANHQINLQSLSPGLYCLMIDRCIIKIIKE
jgi:hypothetical protein